MNCPVCQKNFGKSSHLKTHMQVHSPSKPYTCCACKMKFGYESSLKRHQKKSCLKCSYKKGYFFSDEIDLNNEIYAKKNVYFRKEDIDSILSDELEVVSDEEKNIGYVTLNESYDADDENDTPVKTFRRRNIKVDYIRGNGKSFMGKRCRFESKVKRRGRNFKVQYIRHIVESQVDVSRNGSIKQMKENSYEFLNVKSGKSKSTTYSSEKERCSLGIQVESSMFDLESQHHSSRKVKSSRYDFGKEPCDSEKQVNSPTCNFAKHITKKQKFKQDKGNKSHAKNPKEQTEKQRKDLKMFLKRSYCCQNSEEHGNSTDCISQSRHIEENSNTRNNGLTSMSYAKEKPNLADGIEEHDLVLAESQGHEKNCDLHTVNEVSETISHRNLFQAVQDDSTDVIPESVSECEDVDPESMINSFVLNDNVEKRNEDLTHIRYKEVSNGKANTCYQVEVDQLHQKTDDEMYMEVDKANCSKIKSCSVDNRSQETSRLVGGQQNHHETTKLGSNLKGIYQVVSEFIISLGNIQGASISEVLGLIDNDEIIEMQRKQEMLNRLRNHVEDCISVVASLNYIPQVGDIEMIFKLLGLDGPQGISSLFPSALASETSSIVDFMRMFAVEDSRLNADTQSLRTQNEDVMNDTNQNYESYNSQEIYGFPQGSLIVMNKKLSLPECKKASHDDGLQKANSMEILTNVVDSLLPDSAEVRCEKFLVSNGRPNSPMMINDLNEGSLLTHKEINDQEENEAFSHKETNDQEETEAVSHNEINDQEENEALSHKETNDSGFQIIVSDDERSDVVRLNLSLSDAEVGDYQQTQQSDDTQTMAKWDIDPQKDQMDEEGIKKRVDELVQMMFSEHNDIGSKLD